MTRDTGKKLRALMMAALMLGSVLSISGFGLVAMSGVATAANVNAQQNVVLGAADQNIAGVNAANITITEEPAGKWGTEGTGEINLPDGVIFNGTTSDVTVRQVGPGTNAELTNVQLTDDDGDSEYESLAFDYSGFDQSKNTEIKFGALNIDVKPDAGDTFNITYRVGVETTELQYTAYSADIAVTSDTVVRGQQQAGSVSVDISGNTTDGTVGVGESVIISIPDDEDRFTFDRSASVSTNTADTIVTDVSSREITVQFNNTLKAAETVTVNGISVNVTGDMAEDNVDEFSSILDVTTVPVNPLGTFTQQTGMALDVVAPDGTIFDGSTGTNVLLGPGFDGQDGATNDNTQILVKDDSGDVRGELGAGTNITVKIPDGNGITFDTSQSVSATGYTTVEAGTPVFKDDKTLTVEVTTSSDDGDYVAFTNVLFNVTTDSAAENVNLTYITSAEAAGSAASEEVHNNTGAGTTQSVINVDPPIMETNAATDKDIPDDNDGRSGVETSNPDIELTAGVDGDLERSGEVTAVTITIPGESPLEFDQRASPNLGGFSGGSDTVSITGPKTLEVILDGTDSDGPRLLGESVEVNDVSYNTTGGLSDSTALAYSINRTGVDNPSESLINVSLQDPTDISGDADVTDSEAGTSGPATEHDETGTDAADTTLDVDTTVTSSVYVNNSTLATVTADNAEEFGGAVVDLKLVYGPDLANANVPDTVTTTADGTVNFTFTAGHEVGTYVVNATTDTGAGVNLSYSVTPGQPAEITTNQVDNAIRAREDMPGTANYHIQVKDQFGNLVDDSVDVDISVDSPNVVPAGASHKPDQVVQDLEFINYNETVRAQLEDDDSYDPPDIYWSEASAYENVTFTGQAGDDVVVNLESPATGLSDPAIILVGPDGSELGDDSSNDASIDETLPSDGQYTIIVTGDNDEDNFPYYLHVANSTTTERNTLADDVVVDLALGDGTVAIPAGAQGEAVVNLRGDEAENVTLTTEVAGTSIVDSAQTRIYDRIGGIDVSLSPDPAILNDPVYGTSSATAAIEESDGTKIQVPDVVVDFDDNGDADTSFVAGGADSIKAQTTTALGETSVVISADAVGPDGTSSSPIDANTNLKRGSETLNITLPPLEVTTNVTEVTADQGVMVNATVEYGHYDNTSAVQGATVDVTGPLNGGTITGLSTDANGSVIFTVNASEAGDITVSASKTNTFPDETIITAVRKTVGLNLTANETHVEVGDPVLFSLFRNDTGDTTTGTISVADQALNTGSDGQTSYEFATPGEYIATGIKGDSPDTTFTRNNVTVVVDKKEVDLSITANESTVTAGNEVLYEVRRTDTGSLVNASISVDGKSVDTGSDGVATVELTKAGTVTATASKADSDTETFQDDTVDVDVELQEIQLNLTAKDLASLSAGDEITLSVTKESDGTTVTNANITVNTPDGESVLTTGTNGEATYTFPVSGTYQFNASKSDTASATHVNDSFEVDVDRRVVVLSIAENKSTVEIGETIQFNVTRSDTGGPAENAKVNVTGIEKAKKTDKNGAVSFTFTDNVGTFNVKVNKQDTAAAEFSADSTDVTIEKKTTELNIEKNQTTVRTGDDVLFTVTENGSGDPVDSATVTINGDSYTTGPNGEVTHTFETVGNFTATASKTDTATKDYADDSEPVNVLEAFKLGDVNHDGTVNIQDAIAMKKHIVGLPVDQTFDEKLGDLNGNGYIDPGDVTLILQKAIE